jgi:hypothetical protein
MSSQVPGKGKWQGRIYRLLHKVFPARALQWLAGCIEPSSPPVPGIDDGEKAKIEYEHTMKLREIGLDKGCFTIAGALMAAAFLCLGNYFLEGYRNAEARERALTEQRLKALTAISIAHSRMTRAFFKYSNEEPNTPPEKATEEYKKAIDDLMHETNQYLPLLGREFDEDISWYTSCHRKFRERGVTTCDKFGELASNLDNEFNALCESYLRNGKILARDRMVVKPIPRKNRVAMKPDVYLAEQVKYRLKHHKNDKLDENLDPK